MAEETNDDKFFSPLDSLGTSYGGINRPALDIKGFSPFEGAAPLSLPEINFPIIPVQPSFSGLTNNQNLIRENLVGSPSKKAPTRSTDPNDLLTSIIHKDRAVAQANQDKNEYVKIFAYDPGPTGGNFYKRYAAFGDETFHKLGFHPLLDNEGIYNANTTGWQQTKRMLTHSFWPLFKLGIGSGWDSTVKMFKGDFSANTEDARAFEEAAAIGYNSRGGIGAFMSNTALNFGYTAGIIAEAALEEIGALAVEAVTVGGATPAVATATANNLRKVGNAFRSLDKVGDVGDAMKAVNSSIKAMNNVSNARKFFDAAKIKKAATSFGKAVNPLQNTFDAVKGIIKNEDNLTGLARVANSTKRGFGGFYGDIKAVNMALSEARLEAGIQQNHMYEDLYKEQYKRNGNQAPTDEQQKAMIQMAQDAGSNSLVWNTGLIYASNKIVLDNWVGGKGRGPLSFMKSKTEELLNLEGGKVIKTATSKTLSTGKKFKTSNLQWRKNNLWNTVKAFKDEPLRRSASGAIGYFKRNITEALQENAQEIISEATKNYYVSAYSNSNVATREYAKGISFSSALAEAANKQFSKEGFDTFASGFTMGMFSAPLNALKPAFSIGYNKIFNPEAFAKYKAARNTAGENFVKTMSSIPMEEFFDNNVFDYGSQSDANEIRMSGTEKDARDASDAAFIFKMGSVMQNNMTEFYKDNLQSLSDLTAAEIEEVIPSIPKGEGQKYLDKLPSILQKMDKLENRYKAVNERFPNPINLSDLDKDDAEYDDAVLLHKAWEIGKQNAVFMGESFDDTMGRMASLMNDVISNGPIKKGSFNSIKVLFDQPLLKNELDMLKTQAETLEGLEGSQAELSKTKKKIAALEKLNESLSKFRNYYDVAERARIKESIIEKNPELSPEEINKVVDEELGIRSSEEDVVKTEEFKKAYSEYIKTIGNIEGESVFNSEIDESFEKLKDYYLLSSESKKLAEYVNILHDPQGFYEHIQRNKAWMKELYNNRSEYYENLKEQEFQKKEANDLLNHLASRNLYISFDDLEKFMTTGILPEEIYDDTNKTVIKKSNPLYNELVQPFLMLKEVQSKKSETEIIKDSVKDQLENLESRKAEKLKELPVEEKRVELGPIAIKRSIQFKKLAKELNDGEYVDAVTDTQEEFTFYRDGDVVKYTDSQGEPVTDDNLGKQKFVSANKYKIVSEADPVEVQKINDEFEALKSEIIARAVDKGVEDPESVEPTIYTTDTPLDKLPKDLFNQLTKAFATQYTEETGEMDLSADDFFPALEAFIKSDFLAARIIDDYNKEQEVKRGTEVDTGETPDIKIVINNTPVSLDELDESDVRGFLRTFETELKSLEEKAERTPEENTRISKLKYNIKGIKKFLQGQVRAGFSPEQKKTIDVLEKLIKEQGNIVKTPKGYVVNGQVMQRVTNVIKEFLPEYTYRDETAVRATFAITIGEQGFTVDSIKNFISELRKQKLGGFSEFTYTELEKDLNAILAEPATAPVADQSTINTALEALREDLKSAEGEFKNEELAAQIRSQIAELEKKVTTTATTEDNNAKRKSVLLRKEDLSKAPEFAQKAIAKTVEAIDENIRLQVIEKAYEGITASPIAKELGLTTEQVRSIRTYYGVPDIADKQDYQKWKSGIEKELSALEQPKQATAAGATLLDKILTLVSEKTYQASKDAGNYMDDQIRNLLDNVDPVFDDKKITQQAFDEAFRVDDENPGYVRRIKDIIDKEGLYVLSRVKLEDGTERGFVVYDEDAGIAGEIDLLAVDRFGKLHIIDIKTGKTSKWDGFNNMEKGYSKKDNYTLQQLAYSNLLFNMTDMDSTISLLPIQIDYNSETSIISKVGRPSAKDVLKPGTYRIILTPSEQIKANIESKIPRKTEVVETAVTEPSNIIGEDFEMVEEPFDENLPVEEIPTGSPIENLKKVVSEATQEQLDSLKSELSIAISKNLYSAADLMAIQEVLDERQRELESNVQVKLTSNNVKANDQLIANVGIFMGKEDTDLFASEGDDVVITEIDSGNNTVTLKSLSNGKQKSFTFAELNKMFILKQTVMAFEEEEKEAAPLTKVEKNFVSESIDNVNELLKDNKRKEALRKEAALETMDEIDTDLFDDDSSNC